MKEITLTLEIKVRVPNYINEENLLIEYEKEKIQILDENLHKIDRAKITDMYTVSSVN